MTDHSYPLKPGEIRRHTTRGGKTFQVMHVSNGSFTQASGPDGVICTLMGEHAALQAYAEAIEAAEALEIQVDDVVVRRGEEDGPRGVILEAHAVTEFGAVPGLFVLVSFNGMSRTAMDARRLVRVEPVTEESADAQLAEDLARPLRDAVRRYVPGGGECLLDELVARAEDASRLLEQIREIADRADVRIESESRHDSDRYNLEDTLKALRNLAGYTP